MIPHVASAMIALAGKVIAVLAVLCFAAHVALLVTSGEHMRWTAVSMLAISALCLLCAPRLWRAPRMREWLSATVLAIAMVVLHPLIMTLDSCPHHCGQKHMAAPATSTHDHMLPSPIEYASTAAASHTMLVGTALAASQAMLAGTVAILTAVRRLSCPRVARVQ